MAVCDYPAGFWYFAAPCVIKVSLKPSELLRCGPWCNLVRRNHDIVLFRSLWGARRARMEYMLSNPGIHQEAALFLRRRFPNIRAVGIDWISVSPYKDRSAGRLSHRAFLNPEEAGRPVAIIEDMDLSAPMRGLRSITALPVRIDGLDSAPATVIGAFDD
jgi:kynurenine formamidase